MHPPQFPSWEGSGVGSWSRCAIPKSSRAIITSRVLMSVVENNLPIKMSRANLDDVPEFALPDGFTLRWYQPGDEAHWLRIHLAADRYNEITPELFRKQFGGTGARTSVRFSGRMS